MMCLCQISLNQVLDIELVRVEAHESENTEIVRKKRTKTEG